MEELVNLDLRVTSLSPTLGVGYLKYIKLFRGGKQSDPAVPGARVLQAGKGRDCLKPQGKW